MSRPPDWEKWQHIPDLSLREAVALSLDIDPAEAPSKLDTSRNRFREFQQRLEVAERNLGHNRPLKRRNPAGYTLDEPQVSLQNFSVWAVSIGWQVPHEMQHLSCATSDSKPSPVPKGASLEPGERTTLYKLGAYFARRFDYDPSAQKSSAPGKMRAELQRMNISLDDKTIRKVMKEGAAWAAENLPPTEEKR